MGNTMTEAQIKEAIAKMNNSEEYLALRKYYSEESFINWVEWIESSCVWPVGAGNIEKFIENCDVEPEKLILAIPFYTKLWKEKPDGKTTNRRRKPYWRRIWQWSWTESP